MDKKKTKKEFMLTKISLDKNVFTSCCYGDLFSITKNCDLNLSGTNLNCHQNSQCQLRSLPAKFLVNFVTYYFTKAPNYMCTIKQSFLVKLKTSVLTKLNSLTHIFQDFVKIL